MARPPETARARPHGLPRGMRDISGEEWASVEHIRRRFWEMAALYDYEPVQPSPLELLSTLETKSGPAIRDEIYNFADKGGREVGLRFDFTMGMTRNMAADRSRPTPAKVAGFGGVFRYDEPQKARYRYFHQWDIEIYGRPHPSQDAEIIEFTARLLDSLPVRGTTIRINHREVAESKILAVFEGRKEAVPDMLRAADKIQKKPPDQIVDEFAAKGYGPDGIREIIEFAGISGSPDEVEAVLDGPEANHDAWTRLKELVDSLGSVGVRNASIDFGVVRGLDYYTGMVFEAFGGQVDGALAGGGRYDLLPGAFGRDEVGAAGVAGGVERTMLAMDPSGTPPGPPPVPVIYAKEAVFGQAAALASAIRGAGIPVRLDLAGRPLRKQMGQARSARTAVIVAPREMDDGMVIIRDMSDGSQRTVPYREMMDDPRGHLIP